MELRKILADFQILVLLLLAAPTFLFAEPQEQIKGTAAWSGDIVNGTCTRLKGNIFVTLWNSDHLTYSKLADKSELIHGYHIECPQGLSVSIADLTVDEVSVENG